MIAENIKQYVDKKGIKHGTIARELGISNSSMSALLHGNRVLKAEEYVAICGFLGVPLGSFVGGEED